MSYSHEKSQPARKKPPLGKGLDKKLAAYVAAATAAGVAVLAAPDAVAEIHYTPLRVQIRPGSIYEIDLNHDGKSDFGLQRRQIFHSSLLLAVPDVVGNGVVGATGSDSAAALVMGAAIGPGQRFATRTSYGGFFMANAGAYGSKTWFRGPWKNRIDKYLGLKFLIDGEVHYGWARMSVTHNLAFTALTGFAYETEPNTPIRAGKESGSDDEATVRPLPPGAATFKPATLGALAHGANGLALWRRKEYPLI